ncbi:Copine family protein 2-like [Oopsacas minuta]|uniref:Copine family protein 2-like n=1 Tax=Oopsacas minuta TaxID=111878 RepID=A0AAV7K2T6_9METZ|nr:Copine family protein 2-like [Oopsacas minuta]
MDTLLIIVLILFIVYLVTANKKKKKQPPKQSTPTLLTIQDKYRSFEDLQASMRKAGLESSQLIFGIDYTRSNNTQGEQTFGGHSLHALVPPLLNPYQKVIRTLGLVLEPFDDDNMIPVYGFGDSRTKGNNVFNIKTDGGMCNGVSDTLKIYEQITPHITLSGPTNFAPLIDKAIEIVRSMTSYHILVIIADGQVTNEADTIAAIIRASKYPLSIVMVGVGDGPWDTMEDFDDRIKERTFDNFQFVNFHKVTQGQDFPEVNFALHALMEIPDQFKAIRQLGLL